jgi:hypothetical protein
MTLTNYAAKSTPDRPGLYVARYHLSVKKRDAASIATVRISAAATDMSR